MLSEFIERTGVNVSEQEYYDAINPFYNAVECDKDEFCNYWKKMNPQRVSEAVEEKRQLKAKENNIARAQLVIRKLNPYRYTSTIASNVLSTRYLNILNALNINAFHTVDSVLYDLRKYIS